MTPDDKDRTDRYVVKIVMKHITKDVSAILEKKEIERNIAVILKEFSEKNNRTISDIKINKIRGNYEVKIEVI